MSPSNFLKCSSISICVMFCFGNVNIRERERACKVMISPPGPPISSNNSISFFVNYWTSLTFFRRSTSSTGGGNMLHHKKQETNNPMLCWKFCMGLIHKHQELRHCLIYQSFILKKTSKKKYPRSSMSFYHNIQYYVIKLLWYKL